MGVLSENAIIGASNASGFNIDYSCRFNKGDSSYLSRTPESASNRKTWTMSCWIKTTGLDDGFTLMDAGANPNYLTVYMYQGTIRLYDPSAGVGNAIYIAGTRLLRDVAAWYHIVVQLDTTQATNTDRVKIYVNNERETAFTQTDWPDQNYDSFVNNNIEHTINRTGSTYADCYMAEYHFIDGLALTPSSFGELDADTNQWKAIKYAGTYGTNGFFLAFKSSGALGTDTSGNGNTYASTNLAATDQMIDTPQNSTGGNFSTLNPLIKPRVGTTTYKEGNLKVQNDNWDAVLGTQRRDSGKWYWEVVGVGNISNGYKVGIFDAEGDYRSGNIHDVTGAMSYQLNGSTTIAGVVAAYGASYTNGDIIGIAVDMDASTIQWYKNNAAQGSVAFSGGMQNASGFVPMTSMANGPNDCYAYYNFGQDSSFGGNKTAQGNTDGNDFGDFYYTPPAGYLALCSDNLSDPSIALPGENFNTKLYTGNGGTQSVTGAGFAPDLVWIKNRDDAVNHGLFDTIRGVKNSLQSNSDTEARTAAGATEDLYAFGTDGFSVGVDTGGTSYINCNESSKNYASWNWKSGGAASTNDDGSIDSEVSANTTAGFSIVKWTGTGSDVTVGHGLSQAPDIIINKSLGDVNYWAVQSLLWASTTDTNMLYLNSTGAQSDDTNVFQAAPTASVFSPQGGAWPGIGTNTIEYIAYCFHSVEGYSKIGTYVGNNSTDGTFVYLGFTPAYILLKTYDNTDNWNIYDIKRNGYNGTGGTYQIRADTNGAGFTAAATMVDLVSNGVKMRTNDPGTNSARNYLYMAFAETPFKTANAR